MITSLTAWPSLAEPILSRVRRLTSSSSFASRIVTTPLP
jgi:hypothetical protein